MINDSTRGPWRVDPDNPTWVLEEGAGADGGPGLVAACETEEDAALICALRVLARLGLPPRLTADMVSRAIGEGPPANCPAGEEFHVLADRLNHALGIAEGE
jgi:hypothetical protein